MNIGRSTPQPHMWAEFSLCTLETRVCPEEFEANSSFDLESALNDEDFWVKVSKERAEFKENNADKAVPLNQGVYKECNAWITWNAWYYIIDITLRIFLWSDYFNELTRYFRKQKLGTPWRYVNLMRLVQFNRHCTAQVILNVTVLQVQNKSSEFQNQKNSLKFMKKLFE